MAATTAVVGATAAAGLTPVDTIPPTEATQLEIIQQVYGGTVRADGADFVSETIRARRLADTPAGSMGSVGPQNGLWSLPEFEARAVARFSSANQTLHLGQPQSPNGSMELFSVRGMGFDVEGGARVAATPSATEPQPLVRTGQTGTHSTIAGENADGRDHALVYEIESTDPTAADERTWLVFFEDLTRTPSLSKGRTDSDFNDLVVELRTAPAPAAVPLPTSVYVAAMVITGAFAFQKRLRRIAGFAR